MDTYLIPTQVRAVGVGSLLWVWHFNSNTKDSPLGIYGLFLHGKLCYIKTKEGGLKMRLSRWWAVVLSVFLLCSTAYGGELGKIGVIDFQRILDTSRAGKESLAEIKAEGKKIEKMLKEKVDEIEKIRKSLKLKGMAMNKETKEKKENELNEKIRDFRLLERRKKIAFDELNRRLTRRINRDVFAIVQKIGKEEGYTLIIEKRVGGVVYAPDAIDITDKVIRMYDEQVAKQAKKEKGKKRDHEVLH
nr:OmpH family outer membrane protein [Desulfobacterales bacterium]